VLSIESREKRPVTHENNFAREAHGSGEKSRRRIFGPAHLLAGYGSVGSPSAIAAAISRGETRATFTQRNCSHGHLRLERFECSSPRSSHSVWLSPGNTRAHCRSPCRIPSGAADSCFVAGTKSAFRAARTCGICLVQLHAVSRLDAEFFPAGLVR